MGTVRGRTRPNTVAAVPAPKVIKRVQVDSIPVDGLIVINGRKASGKTFMCHWLLSQIAHKYDAGMFISDSMHTVVQWRKNIPSPFIFCEMDFDLVQDWIDTVKLRNDRRTAKGLPMRKYLLVLDDIGYDSKTLNSEPMRRLIQNARQVGVCVWIITQYLYQLHQQLREAMDFAICFRENGDTALKKLKKDVFNILGKEFEPVFKACTTRKRKRFDDPKDPRFETQLAYDRAVPPRAMCINNRLTADTWQDCVFVVSANFADVEKPWRLANPIHYLLDKKVALTVEEKQTIQKKMKESYARSEVGLQVYNNDIIDRLGGCTDGFILEEDYLGVKEEIEAEHRIADECVDALACDFEGMDPQDSY